MTDQLTTGSPEWISVADTAKLVRAALKRAFPGYAFSVNSRSYAGGASIDVGWYDGPPASVVDDVVRQYAGGRFDGMIDMAYNVQSWLEGDGSAHVAHNPGTQGSRGMDPGSIGDPRTGDARLVHFGADYVHTKRSLTAEAQAEVERATQRKYGPDYAERYPDYEAGRLRWEVESRRLFPPCAFTFSVVRSLGGGEYAEEAAGFATKTAAAKRARELEKARNPRGYRYVQPHRT